MVEMRVALASDAPALDRLIEERLRREHVLAERLDLESGDVAYRRVKALRVLLLVCGEYTVLEKNYGLLCRLLKEGIPVICVTAESWEAHLFKGKTGFSLLRFPERWDDRESALFCKELLVRLKDCYGKREETGPGRGAEAPSRFIVGIGASTGGPKALLAVLKNLPRSCCGIVVVQHLTSGFSSRLAEYLNNLCQMKVKVAVPEELIRDGTVYLAPDGRQTRVIRDGRGFVVKVQERDKVGGFCPSVNCLFESLAVSAGKRAMGVILTGMGRDGADGLLRMCRAGAYTVGQDRATSDIYSMPYEAMLSGGVKKQLPISLIGAEIAAFQKRMIRELGG